MAIAMPFVNRLRVIVHAIDENAYIMIQEVTDLIVSPIKRVLDRHC